MWLWTLSIPASDRRWWLRDTSQQMFCQPQSLRNRKNRQSRYSPARPGADNPNGKIPFSRSQNGVVTSMPRQAPRVEWQALVRRPAARVVFVLLIGTCLWTLTARRERIVENSSVAARESQTTEPASPRTITGSALRQLPQRTLPSTGTDERAVQADFET